VRQGLPFDDNAVGCLRAHDFLEHLAPGAEIVDFWNEAYRVLAPGGWFTSATPSAAGRGADMDPTHKSRWNLNSHWYVTRRESQKYVAGLHAKFQATRTWEAFPSEWHRANDIPYLYIDLACLKGQRQPGPVAF
jgi:SAM-dependent methyltransferase